MAFRRLNDARLIRRSQRGDSRAFVALLSRFDDRLRQLVYALLVDEPAMDRALRSAYLRAWRNVVRVDPEADIGAWLYRFAYNAAIDELRAERRRRDATLVRDMAAAAAAAQADSGADRVAAALAALAPEERVPLVLVEREGFSPAAAAGILGVDQPTFDARLSKARARLAPVAALRRGRRAARRRPTPERPAEAAAAASAEPDDQGREDGRDDRVAAETSGQPTADQPAGVALGPDGERGGAAGVTAADRPAAEQPAAAQAVGPDDTPGAAAVESGEGRRDGAAGAPSGEQGETDGVAASAIDEAANDEAGGGVAPEQTEEDAAAGPDDAAVGSDDEGHNGSGPGSNEAGEEGAAVGSGAEPGSRHG